MCRYGHVQRHSLRGLWNFGRKILKCSWDLGTSKAYRCPAPTVKAKLNSHPRHGDSYWILSKAAQSCSYPMWKLIITVQQKCSWQIMQTDSRKRCYPHRCGPSFWQFLKIDHLYLLLQGEWFMYFFASCIIPYCIILGCKDTKLLALYVSF